MLIGCGAWIESIVLADAVLAKPPANAKLTAAVRIAIRPARRRCGLGYDMRFPLLLVESTRDTWGNSPGPWAHLVTSSLRIIAQIIE